ncbi:hypothetical protein ACU4GD_44475 [Cupriavidus basilensis]
MREPQGSPIRELFPYMSLPGMISFAGGYPSPASFDAGARCRTPRPGSWPATRHNACNTGRPKACQRCVAELSALMAGRGAPCRPNRSW